MHWVLLGATGRGADGMPYNMSGMAGRTERSFGWGMGERRSAVAAQRLLPRRFPIGVQTFEQVVRDFEGYVDKTAFIWELTQAGGKYFFLSRPRRFGKSLLVSTLKAYFEGRRELFEGLAIAELEREWEAYPVIRVDLSMVKTTKVDELYKLLDSTLRDLENVWGRDARDATPGSRFKALINAAHAKFDKPVVVLVDEYDAPLLNVAHDPAKLDEFRQVMREFYAPLKGCDEYLRFVFLTGITKFSQLSIFSELNNLRNISMDPAFASICGITQEELETQYAGDVDTFAARAGMSRDEALAELKASYDGYHFAEPSPDIYNPFSLLNAFAEGRIRPFWFGSGTPTFLIELLHENGWDISNLEGCVARESSFDVPTERLRTPLPMLYQGGYLTIKSYDPVRRAYTLGIPNEEVSHGLSESLVEHAAPAALEDHYAFLDQFADEVRSGDIERALQAMRSYLKGIPYDLGSRDERGFQTKFYLIFDLLGVQIKTEFKTATGRVDAVIETPQAIYIMEFKYDKSAQAALEQIDTKDYAVPFARDGRDVVKVGVNFSAAEQTIDEWVIG